MELTPLQPIQVVTFLVALGLLISIIYWAHVEFQLGYWPYLLGPLSFSLHLLVFYSILIFRQLGLIETGALTIWSAYLRLHGVITLVGMVFMVVRRCRKRSII